MMTYHVTIEKGNGDLPVMAVQGTRYTIERGTLRVYDDDGLVIEFLPGRVVCIARGDTGGDDAD